ncbi:MAG: DUF853 family protein [Alphaproteobacteria bacterium]|nr:DUF853 family protein [Alphaproteobacteria bacterium]
MKGAHPIPDEAAQRVVAYVGTTGSGKTYTAKGTAERFLSAGARVCVLDPTGAWWGLKSNAAGNAAGFSVVVFGGDHADVPIDDTTGAALGDLIAKSNLQCVVDVSAMTMGGRVRFVTAFLEALYAHNRQPLYLILDEADMFAPQRPLPDQTVMLNRVEQIVRRGRIKGFRPWLISQRPAVLHKDVLSQAGTLVAMKLTAPQDRDAIGAWIEGQADRDQGKKLLADLPRLKTGEGYVWSPAAGLLERVKFPAIKTFDSSRTPDDDDEVVEPTRLAEVDLTDIRARLSQVQAKAADADPKALRKRIADLEAKLAQAAPNPAMMVAEHARGVAEGIAQGRLQMASEFGASIEAVVRQFRAATPTTPTPAPRPLPVANHAPIQTPVAQAAKGGAEMRILRVLAQRHPARFTIAQWATLAGMKKSGGTWNTYVSRLRTAGYIDQSNGMVCATAAGLAAAGSMPAQPQTAAEIQAMWRESLGAAVGRMLDRVLEAYPNPIDRTSLAEALGMAASGGTFNTYLSRLRSNGLVTSDGRGVLAADILFGGANG